MIETGTYGRAELLLATARVNVWTTPVVAAGPRLFVSVLIDGEGGLATIESGLLTIELAAAGPDGEWITCQARGGGGGGSDTSIVQYESFERPAELPAEVRLEVRLLGDKAIRVMPLDVPS